MIRKKLLKITLITTIAATLLVSAGCGKKAADNNTIQETKATVSTETKSVAAKEPTKIRLVTFDYTDENGEVHTMEGKIVADENGIATIQAEDTTGSIVEFKGNIITDEKGEVTVKDVVAKSDNPFVKEDGTDVVADADNTVTDESGNEGNNEVMKTETPNDSDEEAAPSEPEYTPSEPTPEPEPEPEAPTESEPSVEPEQPAAPAEPSPAPSTAPAPVVTPQEPAKPSVTEEQQLVATGKWTKIMEWNDGAECRVYEYKDDITGYSVRASFADGEFYLEQWNSLEEEKAIYSAHGITDNVVSFDRLMKLSNS